MMRLQRGLLAAAVALSAPTVVTDSPAGLGEAVLKAIG